MSSILITAVIPTVNEAATITAAFQSCRSEGIEEVIVADGGSSDETRTLALSAGAKVIDVAPAHRARQMNTAAWEATGDLLIFLHADTVFEPGAIAAMKGAARNPQVVGGGFRRRFETSSRLLRTSCAIGNARARHLGWFFGDQAIWARTQAFRQLGGFPEIALFEDLDFTRRLSRLGQTRLIEPGILTSARRFRRGVLNRLLRDFFLTVRHVCVDPAP